MEERQVNYLCKNPVVLVLFNRPDKTKTLLGALSKVTPKRIYVIADGPRAHVPTDLEKTKEVRMAVDDYIKWPCQVEKIYAESNMSGPVRVPSAFDQIFAQEEQVIILEDDCIPVVSFFKFCDELLDRYAQDERVGTVCGFNLEFDFFGRPIDGVRSESYFFSKYQASWGWATWKRVWDNFDKDLDDYPRLLLENKFNGISSSFFVQQFWINKFKDLYARKQKNWDYRLTYSLIVNNQYSIIPNRSLVSNIGADGSGANYTSKIKDYVSNKISGELEFPLRHPKLIELDLRYHKRIGSHFYTSNKLAKSMRIVRNYLTYFGFI